MCDTAESAVTLVEGQIQSFYIRDKCGEDSSAGSHARPRRYLAHERRKRIAASQHYRHEPLQAEKDFPSAEEIFPLCTIDFHGIQVPSPGRPEPFLQRLYGVDWQSTVRVWSHDFNPFHSLAHDPERVSMSLDAYTEMVTAAGYQSPRTSPDPWEALRLLEGAGVLLALRKNREETWLEKLQRRNREQAEARTALEEATAKRPLAPLAARGQTNACFARPPAFGQTAALKIGALELFAHVVKVSSMPLTFKALCHSNSKDKHGCAELRAARATLQPPAVSIAPPPKLVKKSTALPWNFPRRRKEPMDSDSEGAARSAPRPSPLQALRRQWRERQLSPVQQTPTRRLADLLAAAGSPARDFFGDRPGSPTAEVGDRSWQAFAHDAEPHRPGDLGDKEPGASACLGQTARPVLPQPPGEEAFVAARASVRRDEYLKLEMWLLAGGSPEPFAPWFRELLMDADAEAFVAACRAVASHYRRTAQQHALGLDNTAAPCRPWLKGFLERLQAPGSSERLKEAAELAAAVLAAPRPASRSQRHEFFDELALLLPTPGAEALLRGCEGHGALQKEDLEQLRSMVALAPPEPDILEVPLSPSVEHNSFLASPLRPKPSGPEDPLRLLSTSSPKSWRQRLEALEAIQGPDADGVHGQLLWPQLVLQAEDDHPAVAAASLRCLARLAPLLSAPGARAPTLIHRGPK
eukprot:s5653_g4.t1